MFFVLSKPYIRWRSVHSVGLQKWQLKWKNRKSKLYLDAILWQWILVRIENEFLSVCVWVAFFIAIFESSSIENLQRKINDNTNNKDRFYRCCHMYCQFLLVSLLFCNILHSLRFSPCSSQHFDTRPWL